MKRQKEQTMLLLKKTVGEILKSEGHKGLGINKIARIAGVDKKLIYVYFGGLDGLITAYLTDSDYWTDVVKKNFNNMKSSKFTTNKKIMDFYLEKQYTSLINNTAQQQIIKWALSDESRTPINKLEESREEALSEILELLDNSTLKPNVNYRAILSILMAGINYLALLTTTSAAKFCDIDLKSDFERAEVMNAIKMINSWALIGGPYSEEIAELT